MRFHNGSDFPCFLKQKLSQSYRTPHCPGYLRFSPSPPLPLPHLGRRPLTHQSSGDSACHVTKPSGFLAALCSPPTLPVAIEIILLLCIHELPLGWLSGHCAVTALASPSVCSLTLICGAVSLRPSRAGHAFCSDPLLFHCVCTCLCMGTHTHMCTRLCQGGVHVAVYMEAKGPLQVLFVF